MRWSQMCDTVINRLRCFSGLQLYGKVFWKGLGEVGNPCLLQKIFGSSLCQETYLVF